jgi:hypothetical protein
MMATGVTLGECRPFGALRCQRPARQNVFCVLPLPPQHWQVRKGAGIASGPITGTVPRHAHLLPETIWQQRITTGTEGQPSLTG